MVSDLLIAFRPRPWNAFAVTGASVARFAGTAVSTASLDQLAEFRFIQESVFVRVRPVEKKPCGFRKFILGELAVLVFVVLHHAGDHGIGVRAAGSAGAGSSLGRSGTESGSAGAGPSLRGAAGRSGTKSGSACAGSETTGAARPASAESGATFDKFLELLLLSFGENRLQLRVNGFLQFAKLLLLFRRQLQAFLQERRQNRAGFGGLHHPASRTAEPAESSGTSRPSRFTAGRAFATRAFFAFRTAAAALIAGLGGYVAGGDRGDRQNRYKQHRSFHRFLQDSVAGGTCGSERQGGPMAKPQAASPDDCAGSRIAVTGTDFETESPRRFLPATFSR
jgi:hypothetical protein